MAKAPKDRVLEPKKLKGAPIPLFDRLIDEDPDSPSENPIRRFYTRSELIQSIEREVDRILNTRATVKRSEYEVLSDTTLNFGLPEMFGLADFGQFDITTPSGQEHLAHLCEQAITRYEPRLTNVIVSILGDTKNTPLLSLSVQADLAVQEFQGEVTFPTIFLVGSR